MVDIVHKYIPRAQFVDYHARNHRFAVLVCHRRAGKTVAVVNDLVIRAMRSTKKRYFGGYIGPYYNQAKQTAWTYLKDIVKDIPGIKVHESETSITLPNGSKIRVFGIDNADALRGLYFDNVVADEFGMWPGRAWSEVVRSTIADRQGCVTFLGTPKGKNRFFEMVERAKANPTSYYYTEVKASTSGIIPESELIALKEELDENEYSQEFECSFEAALRGSYYGKHIESIERNNQIGDFPAVLSKPVYLAMDIGYRDASAIWWWQYIDGRIRVIDYWEGTSYDAEEIVDMLELRPYRMERIYLPHDAMHKTFQSKKSVMDIFRNANLPVHPVPNPDAGRGLLHGVSAVRKVLRTWPIDIDRVRCSRGLECIKNYSRRYDPDKKTFAESPLHDQYSHGADGFRYACLSMSLEQAVNSKPKVIDINKQIEPTRWTLAQAWEYRETEQMRKNSLGRQRI
ncbi:MAG: terminase family protein [Candidatus Accumulibacter sp. UW25]|jgi:phage terminase large subunit